MKNKFTIIQLWIFVFFFFSINIFYSFYSTSIHLNTQTLPRAFPNLSIYIFNWLTVDLIRLGPVQFYTFIENFDNDKYVIWLRQVPKTIFEFRLFFSISEMCDISCRNWNNSYILGELTPLYLGTFNFAYDKLMFGTLWCKISCFIASNTSAFWPKGTVKNFGTEYVDCNKLNILKQ